MIVFEEVKNGDNNDADDAQDGPVELGAGGVGDGVARHIPGGHVRVTLLPFVEKDSALRAFLHRGVDGDFAFWTRRYHAGGFHI